MNRYARQTQLKDFGHQKQQMLSNARVLVVGAGGLGVPVLQYLTGMGIGTLGIVENDTVSLTNLQRQVLFTEKQAKKGMFKLESAVKRLKKLNNEVDFEYFNTFLDPTNALEIIKTFNLIIDCSDNFKTRYLVNDACVLLNKPFVYGALHGFEGQVSVFNFQKGPTYRCLFPKEPDPEQIPDCNLNGVLGVIPGIIGTLQALEAVKVITGLGTSLSGKLLIYDGLEQSMRKISIPLNPENLKIKELKTQENQFYSTARQYIISVEKLKELMLKKSEIQIVDVRNTDEYMMFRIPNSLHIPIDKLEDRYREIKEGIPVYLICESGKRSFKALQQLKELNPNLALFNVDGGLKRFKKQPTTFL